MAPLPNYLVVGAPKAGTTSLAAYLRAHPKVFMAPAKEVRFFNDDLRFAKGALWYGKYFKDSEQFELRGEATPTYLASPVAPRRIDDMLGDVKIIAVLREPATRSYSEYQHKLGWGAPLPSFEELFDGQPGLPEAGGERIFWHSRYLPQLRAYSDVVPSDRLLVLLFEDMREDPAGTFTRVCDFLGVETMVPPNVGTVYNQSRRIRSAGLRRAMEALWTMFPEPVMEFVDRLNSVPVQYPPLMPGLRRRIAEVFAEENTELARWLGLDLSAWEPAGRPI
ncbi:MAG: sulfotransferase family protein [Acidimicrobiales bacterium]